MPVMVWLTWLMALIGARAIGRVGTVLNLALKPAEKLNLDLLCGGCASVNAWCSVDNTTWTLDLYSWIRLEAWDCHTAKSGTSIDGN
tara:strand:+ start:1823 stop:2083 length:261 start_codon:yes stop_codon:yes gene_type:complete